MKNIITQIFFVEMNMRKHFLMITIFFLLVTVDLYAVDISVGGSLGFAVEQEYGTVSSTAHYSASSADTIYSAYPRIEARPNFGIAANFDFYDFGFGNICIQPGFDFSYTNVNTSSFSSSKAYETLYITTSLFWIKEAWRYSFGPTLGVMFYQYNLNDLSYSGVKPDYKETYAYFIFGAAFEVQYELNERMFAYLTLPVFIEAGGSKISDLTRGVENTDSDFSYFGSDILKILPKLGVMCRF